MKSLSNPVQRKTLADLRLRKHADYSRAYAAAKKRQSASMSWFVAPQNQDGSSASQMGRIGLTVGKVLGKAHQRNRIKRRMREAMRRHVDLIPPGFDFVFHPRRNVLTMKFAKLETEIVRILETARAEVVQVGEPSRPGPPAPVELTR